MEAAPYGMRRTFPEYKLVVVAAAVTHVISSVWM
jgi:hypothetical protein